MLKVNTDGKSKPSIVEQIFALDLNMSFFNDLLVKYMNSSPDVKEVKDEMLVLLVGKGLKVDPKAFADYICYSSEPASDKVDFIKKMLLNGTQLRSDTVSTYLESVSDKNFDSEVFALIVSSASNISERALSNYLFLCKDRNSLKAQNFIGLVKQCHKNVADLRCDALCSGQKISGNILAIYLFATPDSFEVTKEISDYLIECKVKLNTDVQSQSSGIVKLKRFVAANKNNLSTVSEQICSVYKLC